MHQTHKQSSLVLLVLLFLVPIFFVSSGVASISNAKLALVAVGTLVTLLFFAFEAYRAKSFSLPKHYFLWIVVALPVVYLLSALATDPSSLSLFGEAYEVGTFGSMLLSSALLLLTVLVTSQSTRVFQGSVVAILSLSLVTLLVLIKVLFGEDILAFGVLDGKMGNPLGNWTDLAVMFGLLSILSLLALKMLTATRAVKIFLWVLFVVSTALLFVANLSTAYIFVAIVAVLLVLYFFKSERRISKLYAVLIVLSLVFLINPTISEETGKLSEVVSRTTGVQNVDVRPSLSTTLNISRAALSENVLLGSGPNTFGRDWLVHKPVAVNATPFWGITFPFGVGFIPTQVGSTGVLGTLAWITFLVLFASLVVRAIRHLPEGRREKLTVLVPLVSSLYLWISFTFHMPSFALLTLAFIFTGLFVSSLATHNILSVSSIALGKGSQRSIAHSTVLAGVAIAVFFSAMPAYDRIVSAYHFQQAINASNESPTDFALMETYIDKAIEVYPLDTYYGALARVKFAEARAALENTERSAEENGLAFSDAVLLSVNSARTATEVNPKGYNNWVLLGSIYSALTPPPFSVSGSYESAKKALSEAALRNPNSPEVPLILARTEFYLGNIEEARRLTQEAIQLKTDYTDAYFLLAQIELSSNNLADAIRAAEAVALLSPGNTGIFFELGLMKYLNTDYEGAAQAFLEAVRIVPDYANAKYYLGLSLVRLGEEELALEQFESVLASNPDNEELIRVIDEIRDGGDIFRQGFFN